MTFRTRVFLAFAAGLLLPLALVMYGMRHEMTARLTAEYERRVSALADLVQQTFAADAARVDSSVATIAARLAADNRFRAIVVPGGDIDRGWLLDYGAGAMRAGGLVVLRVQDSAGRVLSSGHFRNEFDRRDDALPQLLARDGSPSPLVRMRTAEGNVLALARVDSFAVAGRRFVVLGGRRVDQDYLQRAVTDPDLGLTLVTPDDTLRVGGDSAATAGVVRQLTLPYVDDTRDTAVAGSARIMITRRSGALDALRRGVDRWFIAATAATLLLAVLVAAWLSAQVARPIAELARKTAALDLERLDQDFATERPDEVGALSRVLSAMTTRLRLGAARLREAERRATVGDVARQVNHDVKNGLAPIKHVLRHLGEVAEREPDRLAAVFEERRGTLDSSVDYLETLARNYARLSPATDRDRCDVNAVVRQVLHGTAGRRTAVRSLLADALPPIRSDGVALRRILENLVGNAMDSLTTDDGTVTISTELIEQGSARAVRLAVADTGRGMTREELDLAFGDFYTTKPGGTGLGLSVVRRLVADLGGTLRVTTEPGTGSRFVVDLPADGGSA